MAIRELRNAKIDLDWFIILGLPINELRYRAVYAI